MVFKNLYFFLVKRTKPKRLIGFLYKRFLSSATFLTAVSDCLKVCAKILLASLLKSFTQRTTEVIGVQNAKKKRLPSKRLYIDKTSHVVYRNVHERQSFQEPEPACYEKQLLIELTFIKTGMNLAFLSFTNHFASFNHTHMNSMKVCLLVLRKPLY